MSPSITIIAIVAADGAIGRGGDQPFHIREDFRRFKEATMGKPIVMGRRTFEALPKGALPDRRNIVLTSDPEWSAPGAERAATFGDAILMCQGCKEIMVIGGGTVYRQAMAYADRLLLTRVDATVDGADTFFPEIDPRLWKITEESAPMTDPRSGATFRFITYSLIL